jgi:hypothetical protein
VDEKGNLSFLAAGVKREKQPPEGESPRYLEKTTLFFFFFFVVLGLELRAYTPLALFC